MKTTDLQRTVRNLQKGPPMGIGQASWFAKLNSDTPWNEHTVAIKY